MKRISTASGLLDVARQCPSPNFDERPAEVAIELIVVHGISLPPGEFGGDAIDRLFTNSLDPGGHPCYTELRGLRVSAHLLIRRTGEIVQYVPFHRRAWHAGQSCYRGRVRCNDFSVGIELEGTDTQSYELEQYARLAEIVVALRQTYPSLVTAQIVGHCDIAPNRKTDPGPSFQWALLDERLAALAAAGLGRQEGGRSG